jgi:hypothetical protein
VSHGRHDDLALSSLDFLGESADLLARAQEQVREASGSPPPASQRGADASDSVRVAIDAEGRVEGVEISPGWRDRIEPDAFPASLFDAYAGAVRKMVDAAAVAALRSQEGAGETSEPARPATAGVAGPPATAGVAGPPADEREWLAATWSLLHDIDEQLRRLDQVNTAVEARDGRRATVASPHGYLTARMEGPAIREITGDVQRLRAAGTEQLRLEALALFRAIAGLPSTDPSPL